MDQTLITQPSYTLTEDDMSQKWKGDHVQAIFSIHLGTTSTTVAHAFLEPGKPVR